MKVVVTGGAGFIGSNMVESLLENDDNRVTVIDNLSGGRLENLQKGTEVGKSQFEFINQDLTKGTEVFVPKDVDILFHFAANPDVRVGFKNPRIHFEQNIVGTFNILEQCRMHTNLKEFVFASTSTVYGDARQIPTSEEYGPLKPISTYAASKLASESIISAYANTYGFRAVIFRLANVIGHRSTHGIVYDFVRKLKANPKQLEILGDGLQNKSYLDVKDCIEAMTMGLSRSGEKVEIYNVGSEDQVNVLKIAEIACFKMGLSNVERKFITFESEGRGWSGDVKIMRLDISKMKSLGWKPKMNSAEAVGNAVMELLRSREFAQVSLR